MPRQLWSLAPASPLPALSLPSSVTVGGSSLVSSTDVVTIVEEQMLLRLDAGALMAESSGEIGSQGENVMGIEAEQS
jgi:hypothetical protein